jgi:hypothetical protein
MHSNLPLKPGVTTPLGDYVTLGFEGKPNANHVRAKIRTHVHNDYIIEHHHTMLKVNSGKVLYLHQDVQDIHRV